MRLSGGLLFMLLIIFACSVQAQQSRYGTLKGTIRDSANRTPIEAATVSVFLLSDSSLVSYALSTRRGEFQIKEIPIDAECQLLISFNGFRSFTKKFKIPEDKKEWVLEPVYLAQIFTELEDVVVVGQRPPMLIKKDTIEFNAASFRTQPNAVLEDLLKQLPGVDIDKDGNLTMNGKKVSKITIDGKDFFGNDPLVALKNLPRNIIEKVQVADNKTREAQFNKTTTGNEDKVINLTLKKDQKQGWFGRVSGGYGSEKRYESGASLNYFDDKTQVNFIGNMNNTNQSGGNGSFSINNAQSSFGGGGSGIIETKSGGANYSRVFNKKMTLSSSYFLNDGYNANLTRLRRQNILQDSTFFYNSINSTASENTTHRANVGLDLRPDSFTNINLNTFYTRTDNSSTNNNDAESTAPSGKMLNTSKNMLNNNSGDDGLGAELFMGRRLRKEGRSVSLNLNYSYNDQLSRERNNGENVFYKTDGSESKEVINQRRTGANKDNTFAASVSYSEPLMKDMMMLLRYSYRATNSTSGRLTYRFNPATGEHDIVDSAYTNSFRNRTSIHHPDVSFMYTFSDKLKTNIGLGVQMLTQENESTIQKDLKQQYTNFFPNLSMGYQFARTGEVNIFYTGSSQQPSIQQLQPVPDNSNPLYLQLGNPDLRPSFNHNINLNVRYANAKNYCYGSMNYSMVNNQIVQETYYDSLGRQVSRPINVNGNYNAAANFAFSKNWKKNDWSIRVNSSVNAGFGRNQLYTNKVKNITKNYTASLKLGISGTYKELITFQPAYSIRFNDTRYSIQSNRQAEFIFHQLQGSLFWNWPKRVIVENNIQYTYNGRIADGFRKGMTLWNAAVNLQLFKNKQGILRFAVYDLLKQNTSVRRQITQDYIQDTEVQILQRYCMLSFIYDLRKFGKTGK